MKALLNLTEALKAELTNNKLINQVTFGTLDEVELLKRDNYPMAHVGISSGSIESSTSEIEVNILFLDIVDVANENVDTFNDSELYVMNNMLAAATKTTQELQRGTLYENGFQLEDEANVEFFSDKFEDKLAGVGLDLRVTIQNSTELC
jgi:hypothetical protein